MKKLYAIRDDKACIYNAPCIMDNDSVAIRSFSDMVFNDSKTLIALHPEDFSLWFIGEFDSESASLNQPAAPLKLAQGSDFINK